MHVEIQSQDAGKPVAELRALSEPVVQHPSANLPGEQIILVESEVDSRMFALAENFESVG